MKREKTKLYTLLWPQVNDILCVDKSDWEDTAKSIRVRGRFFSVPLQYHPLSSYKGHILCTQVGEAWRLWKEREKNRWGVRQGLGLLTPWLSDPEESPFFWEVSAGWKGIAPASLPGSGLHVSCEDGAARAGEGLGQGWALENMGTVSGLLSAASPCSSISCRKVSWSRGRVRSNVHPQQKLCRRHDHSPALHTCILLVATSLRFLTSDTIHNPSLSPKPDPGCQRKAPDPPLLTSFTLRPSFFFLLLNPYWKRLW